jgi:hypothetical protein
MPTQTKAARRDGLLPETTPYSLRNHSEAERRLAQDRATYELPVQAYNEGEEDCAVEYYNKTRKKSEAAGSALYEAASSHVDLWKLPAGQHT